MNEDMGDKRNEKAGGETVGKGGTGGKGERWWLPKPTGDVDVSVAYSNPTTRDLMKLYATWARSYDGDLLDTYGYKAPADAVAALASSGVARDARILDLGCGTGIAGALLAENGFTRIDGADLSPEMREVAGERGVYNRLFELDMTAPYCIAEPYDSVICVGVFGYGPPNVEHLPMVPDAARPGATVFVTVNGMGWKKMGWDESLAPTLRDAGVELVSRTKIRHMVKEGVDGWLLQLRRDGVADGTGGASG